MFEALTLNAAYPSCHANEKPFTLAHFDELDFKTLTALASGSEGGI